MVLVGNQIKPLIGQPPRLNYRPIGLVESEIEEELVHCIANLVAAGRQSCGCRWMVQPHFIYSLLTSYPKIHQVFNKIQKAD